MSTDAENEEKLALFRLTTPKLVEMYNQHIEHAELIQAILISRAQHYEEILKVNNELIQDLQRANEALGLPAVTNSAYNPSEVAALRTRIVAAIREHERIHGQRE